MMIERKVKPPTEKDPTEVSTRVSEQDMADVVRRILQRRPKQAATFAELFDLVPNTVNLSKEDRAASTSRPGEEKWQQIVRNLASHAHEGFVHIRAGLRLNQRR